MVMKIAAPPLAVNLSPHNEEEYARLSIVASKRTSSETTFVQQLFMLVLNFEVRRQQKILFFKILIFLLKLMIWNEIFCIPAFL